MAEKDNLSVHKENIVRSTSIVDVNLNKNLDAK